ncbi:MocE family 2Fe-2S type ferredoxin [Paenibacillus sp. LjRoot56]|uniref:MocE family 2Fe-2S type ferredoxin n=1 Tax=Paenibacillus sp. LjRoot56 TaxID=3342333 RepID=UPI003ECD798C
MQLEGWIEACTVNDIEQEDVIRFDYENRTFAIYRSQDNGYYATDGFCTHEKVHLANGLVIGHWIECPKHNGRFDYTTGQAKKRPACERLTTYPVQVVTDKVYIQIN